jgi:hypothetical protein
MSHAIAVKPPGAPESVHIDKIHRPHHLCPITAVTSNYWCVTEFALSFPVMLPAG